MRFLKAHGLANDFLLVPLEDAPSGEASRWVPRFCDRHIGEGGDGVILFASVADGMQMRLVNADGGDAEISGNGLRCVAAAGVRAGIAQTSHVVHTAAGPRAVEVRELGPGRYSVRAELGTPRLRSGEIPVALSPERQTVLDFPIDVAGETVRAWLCSMGNPHCALFFDEEVSDEVIRRLGPALERHPLFPNRTNVEFVTVRGPGEIRARFWERGVGYTTASGTGASSAAVASILAGRAARDLRVVCDGGVLEVQWPEGGILSQTGEVEILVEGRWVGPQL